MNKEKTELTKPAIRGIFHWCDRWCEKCSQTGLCTLYKNSSSITPEEIMESLPEILETAKKMLKDILGKKTANPDALTISDFENEYDWKAHLIRKNDGVVLAKKYRKKVKRWLNSLKDQLGMEIRMQDHTLSDYMDVIFWYEAMLEIKMERALISKQEEEEESINPYDSLGNAKLLLVSIGRSIEAWSYLYEKFKNDEDLILDILINLKNLSNKIEQIFPEARAFIRPGLD